MRGFAGDGYVVGSKKNKEANIYLNAQAWAVISGAATPEQARRSMNKVYKKLSTPWGVMMNHPGYRKYGLPVSRMILFPAGTKENSGCFSQPQGWVIRAEGMLGRGNRAYEYYNNCNPARMNNHAEIRLTEPYAHSQYTDGKESPNKGRSHTHWLTGTAGTVLAAAVESILGIQPDYNGIRISPSIPSGWKKFSMKREFRGKKLNIAVKNPGGVEHGVRKIVLNGADIHGDYIDLGLLRKSNDITVHMGA